MAQHRMPRRHRIARAARSVPAAVRRPAVSAPLAVLVSSAAMVVATSAALNADPLPEPTSADAATTSPVDQLPELPAEAPATVDSVATTLGTYADYARAAADVPDEALVAYQRAASVMLKAAPECNLEWSVLAAIGGIASDHGGSDVATAAIVDDGRAAPDTDGGALDGDAANDLPVGPLQLLPATWTVVAVDGDNDGTRDAEDLDDAALAAGVVLCGSDRDLSDDADFRAALQMFNSAPRYPAVVTRLASVYEREIGDVVDPGTLLAMGPPPTAVSTTSAASHHSQSPLRTPGATDDPTDGLTDKPWNEPRGDDDDVTSLPSDDSDSPSDSPSDDATPDETESPTETACPTPSAEPTEEDTDEAAPSTSSLPPCTPSETSSIEPSTPSTTGPSA